MGHVYWEKEEIPCPEGSYIDKTTGQVFIYNGSGPRRSSKRITLGYGEGPNMHPNDTYRALYPEEWKRYYGEEVDTVWEMHPGLYAATLGIGYSTGLYEDLRKSLASTMYANAIMDYGMYSILWKSDVSMTFHSRMEDQVLFSKDRLDDNWYSDFFGNRISKNSILKFRDLWLARCKSRGITAAYICIDGSNVDSRAVVDIAGKGEAKTKGAGDVVGFIWAVAQDGTPLLYAVNHGSVVDCKAVMEVIKVLLVHGIRCEGVVIDRGFCTDDCLDELEKAKLDYVLMLRSDVAGHTDMLSKHGKKLNWQVEYAVTSDPLFGISEKGRVFSGTGREAFLHLFYHGINGSERKATLISKVIEAREEMRRTAAEGKKPTVPEGMGKYLSVKRSGRHWKVLTDNTSWQAACDAKGFFTIATSRDMSTAEANRVYNLRDVSEKTYAALKTGLGYDTMRAHSKESIEGKFLACFVASIIRNELERTCLSKKFSTNLMIGELGRIKMIHMLDGSYNYVKGMSERQKSLLSKWDILPDDFNEIAADYNHRMSSPAASQVRSMPVHGAMSRRRTLGKQKAATSADNASDSGAEAAATPQAPKKKRGRPAGSGRKAREPKQTMGVGRGRKKGSKNKKTLAREAEMAAKGIVPEKRKRGRPKGSKDKQKRKPRTKRGS